ncbi:hypothetical protein CF65_00264 [Aggregatibacter actinomycetemcomitans HK1651]|nr:hypothetical protein CF65_00264 [Aggregatibacter actinomycetemcomitans HK1651]
MDLKNARKNHRTFLQSGVGSNKHRKKTLKTRQCLNLMLSYAPISNWPPFIYFLNIQL